MTAPVEARLPQGGGTSGVVSVWVALFLAAGALLAQNRDLELVGQYPQTDIE